MEILFLIAGLFMFLLGAFVFWDHFSYMQDAIETKGWIKGYKKVGGSNKNLSYYPIVTVSVGGYREFVADSGSSSLPHMIGDEVTVFYKEGEVPKLKSSVPYVVGGFLLVFGFGFMLLFYHIFSFDSLSMAIAAMILLTTFFNLRKKMLKHGVRTWADIKSEIQKAKREHAAIRASIEKPDILKLSEDEEILESNQSLYSRKAEMGKSYKVVGPIFLLVGLGVMVGGILFFQHRYDFIQIAQPSFGEVVDLEESYSDDSYVYYPIVEYTPPNSYDRIRFRHKSGSNPPSYRVGDEVNVLLDPADPNNAMIDNGIFNYFLPVLIVLFGSLFALAGWHTTRLSLKRKKYLELSGAPMGMG